MPDWFRGTVSAFVFAVGVWVVILSGWANELSQAITRLEVHRASYRIEKVMTPKSHEEPFVKLLTKQRAMLNDVNALKSRVDDAIDMAAIAAMTGAVILAGPPLYVAAALVGIGLATSGSSIWLYKCGRFFPCHPS